MAAAQLTVRLSDFDLADGVDFAGVVFEVYLNVPLPHGEPRPFVQAQLASLTPQNAATQTAVARLPVPSVTVPLIQQNARLGPSENDFPSLVVQMLHTTKNKARQEGRVEQGVAILPLGGWGSVRAIVPFRTTYEHYNDAALGIRTQHGLAASSGVACMITATMEDAPAVRTGSGLSAAQGQRISAVTAGPPVCDRVSVPMTGRAYLAVMQEYRAMEGHRSPLAPSLASINFACYVDNGCMQPGYAHEL